MRKMLEHWRSWQKDRLLRSVIRNSSYLFSSNTIMAALGMLQSILVARLVGMDGLGLVTTITVFVSNVHRFVSFRMNEVVVRNLGEALEKDDRATASAVIRWAAGVESITSLGAWLITLFLSPWAAAYLAKDETKASLILLYSFVLLGNLVYETSAGILQTLRRFDLLAKINVVQSLITVLTILVAFFIGQGIVWVVVGYFAGKFLAGILVASSAGILLSRALGSRWWAVPSPQSFNRKVLFGFAVNTNLQGTVNLIVRDNIPLLLAALRSATEVGYFKLALSLINLIMLPIEPMIWPTYTEISRTIASRHWGTTLQLLRRISQIAAVWTLSAGGVIAVFGPWLIPLVYGATAAPAYLAFLLLFPGYGLANILNWNRPLMLALGKPGFPVIVAVLAGIIELALTVWLVPRYGYLMQALILSGFFIVSISIVSWRGIYVLRHRARIAVDMPVA